MITSAIASRSSLVHNRTGRIVRERQYQKFCLIGDRIHQLLVQLNGTHSLLSGSMTTGTPSAKTAHGMIGYITWLWDQHFIARIDHDTHRKVDRLTAAYGHQHLVDRS